MPDRPTLLARSRAMRRQLTPAELKLWFVLKNRALDGMKFRRQVPIGRYIADFACFNPRLIVEVDGGQHAESDYDAERDAWLNAQGFNILRVWNGEVMENVDGVARKILAIVGRR